MCDKLEFSILSKRITNFFWLSPCEIVFQPTRYTISNIVVKWNGLLNAYSSIHRMFHNSYKCVCMCVFTIHVLCMHDSYCFVYSYRHSKLFPSVWYRILWSRWFVCLFSSLLPSLSISRFPSRILLVFRFRFLLFLFFISFHLFFRKSIGNQNRNVTQELALLLFLREKTGESEALARSRSSKIERLEQTSCMKKGKKRESRQHHENVMRLQNVAKAIEWVKIFNGVFCMCMWLLVLVTQTQFQVFACVHLLSVLPHALFLSLTLSFILELHICIDIPTFLGHSSWNRKLD